MVPDTQATPVCPPVSFGPGGYTMVYTDLILNIFEQPGELLPKKWRT